MTTLNSIGEPCPPDSPQVRDGHSPPASFFSRLYLRLYPKPRILFAASAACVCACALLAANASVRDDITILMPSRPAYLADQYMALREAPIARMLTITVSGADPAQAAKLLAQALRGPEIPTVFTGSELSFSPALLTDFCVRSPGLMEGAATAAISELLTEDAMIRSLRKDASLLLSARGIAMRELLAMDPLGICAANLRGFISKNTPAMHGTDGRHALILAEPASSLTDSDAASAVMACVRRAAQALPQPHEVMVVGGHRHTEENAAVIQNDIRRILPLSILLLALAFGIFVRTRQGLAIVLLPGAALAVAAGGVILIYGEISGIVLGFGSAVLGITSDYAIHVYFAIRSGRSIPDSLDRVRLPLALGAATTLAAFAAFFSSSIPGIVQLTWFAIFGVAAAGILALIVLPHCLTPGTGDPDRTTSGARDTTQDAFFTAPGVRPKIRPLAALWTASVIVLGLLLYSLPISSDITALSYVSEANRTDERRTREIWGELRERALVAVIGDTMQHALEKNDRLWTALHAIPPENAFPAEDVFGLASILPAQSTQHARQRIWQEFWAEHGPAALARLSRLAHAERFAPEAFLPFKAWIESTPPLITPQFFIDAGFSLPLTLLRRTGDKHLIYSLVPAVPLNPELAKTMRVNDAVYVSGQSFRDALHSATRTDILHFGALALAGILAIIFWGLRSPARTGLALLPIAVGLACVLAVFHLAGMSLNIFHAMALPLVMALSVDYGVFMLAHLEGKLDKASRTGILLSGITSLSSFGVLMLADHPALFSLGFTVSFGLGGAVLAALCVLPFFVTTGTTPGHEDANHSFV